MNGTVAPLTAGRLLGASDAAGSGTGASSAASLILSGFALATVVPLLALIAGTGSIGPEIDDGSIVHLIAEPLARSRIVVSEQAVSVTVVLVPGAVPTLVAGLVLVGGQSRLALEFALAAAAAGLCCCAIFTLLAVVNRRAVVIGLFYVLMWALAIGRLAPGARALTVQQWALSLAEAVVGEDASRFGLDAAVGPTTGVVALLLVTGLFT